jgi:chromosome segregation ATPase
MKTPITAQSRNPLQRRALTPAEYAQLHHTVQSKASLALQNLNDKLEAELAAARAVADEKLAAGDAAIRELHAKAKALDTEEARLRKQLQRREAALLAREQKLAQTEADIEASIVRGRDRLKVIRAERAKVRNTVAHGEARLARSAEQLADFHRRAAAAEAELAPARARALKAEAALEGLRDRAVAAEAALAKEDSVEARVTRLMAVPPADLDEGERNLLELERELSRIDGRRKSAEAA